MSRVDHNERCHVVIVAVVVVYQSPDLYVRKVVGVSFSFFVFTDYKHLCFHCLRDCPTASSVPSFLFFGEEGFHN
jgi:hypothetical protein